MILPSTASPTKPDNSRIKSDFFLLVLVAPHCGQDSASALTSVPHSRHFSCDMTIPILLLKLFNSNSELQSGVCNTSRNGNAIFLSLQQISDNICDTKRFASGFIHRFRLALAKRAAASLLACIGCTKKPLELDLAQLNSQSSIRPF